MYTDLTAEGIQRELYIGRDEEAYTVDNESWEQIVERNIGYHVVPHRNIIRAEDMKHLEELVVGLERAIALFKKKMKEHGE